MSTVETNAFPALATHQINQLKIKLFADGAVLEEMHRWYLNPCIKGFTTNPSLMKAAQVDHYQRFAERVLHLIKDRPVSFETFADSLTDMEAQAQQIAAWGKNVNIKIPITNTAGIFTGPILERLSAKGISLNVTAMMTLEQVETAARCLKGPTPAILSVFAGRIADTGIDPMPLMTKAAHLLRLYPHIELLWASPRETLNIFQANAAGCHIITVPPHLLEKLSLLGKDLKAYSLETVKQFHHDACAAEYAL
ncbi:MAG: transaldolase [Coxiella sp. RIFCSPHIGHO2_12_FULL_44_14]|nr:MAG: transaldolase [Coxiella sp. RIFCSPHIGHO2_12_FULL_44_14]